jgi:hypothetical protein
MQILSVQGHVVNIYPDGKIKIEDVDDRETEVRILKYLDDEGFMPLDGFKCERP